MDFDNPKVYGDTFISDGLVVWVLIVAKALNSLVCCTFGNFF